MIEIRSLKKIGMKNLSWKSISKSILLPRGIFQDGVLSAILPSGFHFYWSVPAKKFLLAVTRVMIPILKVLVRNSVLLILSFWKMDNTIYTGNSYTCFL